MPEGLFYVITVRSDGAFICDVYENQAGAMVWVMNNTVESESDAHKWGREQAATSLMDDEDDCHDECTCSECMVRVAERMYNNRIKAGF